VVIIGFNVRPGSAPQIWLNRRAWISGCTRSFTRSKKNYGCHDRHAREIEKEKILGKAEVREVFRVPKIGAIAGCMVLDGIIKRNARARLISRRASSPGKATLRRCGVLKMTPSEVREGFECGIGLENFNDIKVAIRSRTT